ncbi:hypothetical protein S83_020854 [Arachis hypogaea]
MDPQRTASFSRYSHRSSRLRLDWPLRISPAPYSSSSSSSCSSNSATSRDERLTENQQNLACICHHSAISNFSRPDL